MRHIPPHLIAQLVGEWNHVARPAGGRVAIQLHDLDSSIAGRLDYTAHYAASTLKLVIAVTALAEIESGRAEARQSVVVSDAFPSSTGRLFRIRPDDDNDPATWGRLGHREALGTLLERMIVDSSNIAANLITQQVTLAAVARTVTTAPAPGLAMHHLFGDLAARRSALRNTVTADGLSRLMRQLARGRLLTAQPTRELLELLERQTTRRMIPAGLPAGTWSAGKPGWLDDVAHDVQLVRPDAAPAYILAVCTTTDLGSAADDLIARISRITWEHWMTWHDA